MVIENKVSAPLAPNQLETYGKWLAKESRGAGSALVFLTHTTPSPDEFLAQGHEGLYGVTVRAVCSWMEVYEGLHRQIPSDAFANKLLREFLIFLEERRMNGITKEDTNVLQAMLLKGMVPKVESLFARLREQVQSQLEHRGYDFEAPKKQDRWDSQTISEWCYFNPEHKKKWRCTWYVLWGLTANASELCPDPSLNSDLPLAFLHVGYEKGKVPFGRLSAKLWKSLEAADWVYRDEVGWLTTKSVQELARDPAGITIACTRWLALNLNRGDEILHAYYKSLKG
jgi:hypothetical protein